MVGPRVEPVTTVRPPRPRRMDVGGVRVGAMWGSRRAAYSMTSSGTRNPWVSSSTWASGLPRWVERLRPGPAGPRGGRLGEVAEHGQRAGRGPTGQDAQHHRGQVLGLVDDDVGQRRRALHQVGRLVEQHAVGDRPAGRSPGSWGVGPSSRARCSSWSRTPSAASDMTRGSEKSCHDEAGRVERRPGRVDVVLDRLAARHRVLHAIVRRLPGQLHPDQDAVGAATGAAWPGRRRTGRPGAAAPRPPPAPPRHRPASAGSPAGPGALRGGRGCVPDGAPQHLGHPGVALERGHGRGSTPATAAFGLSRRNVSSASPSIVVWRASISPSAGSTSAM